MLLVPEDHPAGSLLHDRLLTHSIIVISGEALAVADGRPARRLGRGDVLGLLCSATSPDPDATVHTLTPVRLLVADESASIRLLSLPGVARALVQGAAARGRAERTRHWANP